MSSSQILPIKRNFQRTRKTASRDDSVPMAVIDREQRTLKFLDESTFIDACRFLNEKMNIELYE